MKALIIFLTALFLVSCKNGENDTPKDNFNYEGYKITKVTEGESFEYTGKKAVTTIAGTYCGNRDDDALSAQICSPIDIEIDSKGVVYFTDHHFDGYHIKKITPEKKVVTIKKIGKEHFVNGLAVDSNDNLYATIAKGSSTVSRIIKITPEGTESVFIEDNGKNSIADGPKGTAGFSSIQGIDFDDKDNLYVADGSRIRKITPSGDVSTVVGKYVRAEGDKDGIGENVHFNSLQDVEYNPANGYLYFSELSGKLRKVNLNTREAIKVKAHKNGVNEENKMTFIAISNKGDIYGTGSDGSKILKLTPSEEIIVFAGEKEGYEDGSLKEAGFYEPKGITTDKKGNIIIADHSNDRIRKITLN